MKLLEDEEAGSFPATLNRKDRLQYVCWEPEVKRRRDRTLCGAVGSGDAAEINSLGPTCHQMSLESVCNVFF